MLPSPNELQYFIEVSHTLNISRAAERLGITQPTLSLVIQRLEHSLGMPLLIRSKSGVTLTKTGQRFVTQAKSLLGEWERVRDETLRDQSEMRGRFTIGCHPSVALYSLNKFLPKLLCSHEQLEIKLVHDLSRRITESVVSYEVDFGIVVNPVQHPDLVIQQLAEDEVTFWSVPKLVAENPAARDILVCDPNLLQTEFLLKQMKKAGISFNRVVPSSSLEVITNLVAAGMGTGILPSRVASRDPSLGLKRMLEKGPVFLDRICLIYRPDAQKSKAGKAILNSIRKAYGLKTTKDHVLAAEQVEAGGKLAHERGPTH